MAVAWIALAFRQDDDANVVGTPTGVVAACVPGPQGWIQGDQDQYDLQPTYAPESSQWQREVVEFAEQLDGYVAAWAVPQRNYWLHIGIAGADIASAQQLLEQRFPGEGIVAVRLDHTTQELEAMAQQLARALPTGFEVDRASVRAGTIIVRMDTTAERSVEELAELAAEYPLCVSQAGVVATGAASSTGDGWSVITEVDRSLGQRVALATSDEAVRALWLDLGVATPHPTVDWQQSIVAAFEVGYGSNCSEIGFDGVKTREGAINAINPIIRGPESPDDPTLPCMEDYNPRTFVVMIDRAKLPPPPIVVRSGPDVETEVVTQLDLRQPGATLP